MRNSVTIIDYGMGNLRSVQKAFERINITAHFTKNPKDLLKANKILLPGVGHFGQGMKNLETLGFIEAIKEAVFVKEKCIMGICLGMQLLTEQSEEANVSGLGLVKGSAKSFPTPKKPFKIPHMGWNSLITKKITSISKDLLPDDSVYFVHSYYVNCTNRKDVLFQTEYGLTFDSAFQHENILGFQFHPEKSHKAGLKLLKNFIKL